MKRIVLMVLVGLAVLAGSAHSAENFSSEFLGSAYINLADQNDQVLIEKTWASPRTLAMAFLEFDLVSSAACDSSYVIVEVLKTHPSIASSPLWVTEFDGAGTGGWVRLLSAAGLLSEISTGARVALDSADGLSIGRHAEYLQGGSYIIYFTAAGFAAGQAAYFNEATYYPVYGVRLRLDSEPTIADNTGVYTFALTARFLESGD